MVLAIVRRGKVRLKLPNQPAPPLDQLNSPRQPGKMLVFISYIISVYHRIVQYKLLLLILHDKSSTESIESLYSA